MQSFAICDMIPVLCGRNVLTEGGGRTFPNLSTKLHCVTSQKTAAYLFFFLYL